jgi:putative transposase
MIDFKEPQVSVSQQCRLLNLCRSTLYYKPVEMAPQDLALMRWIDEQYTEDAFLRIAVYDPTFAKTGLSR